MHIGVITLFPEMFDAVIDCGITSRAVDSGLLKVDCWNPRTFTSDRHQTVDDRPYGGGPGMVMKIEPLRAAITAARSELPQAKVIYLSPQGRRFDQRDAEELVKREQLIFVAGRYEGIDERVIETEIDEEWSIGDYVLSGGELAAMVMIDAVTRLLPGALGDEQSAQQDSFTDGLLDCPHYTRPEEYEGRRVPDVLTSGNHELIRRWRLKQSLGRTWLRRPELLAQRELDKEQQRLLDDFIGEQKAREQK
ncbi:MAG: tRNA (guanosine(37)-N1)-methyltransferase TrmD [Spongiibacteraceae bacterium]